MFSCEHTTARGKVDRISCRNLLIYLGGELQKRALPVFRYALNPGGVLFLGSSETVGDSTDLFSVVDKKWRIFKARRRGLRLRERDEFAFP